MMTIYMPIYTFTVPLYYLVRGWEREAEPMGPAWWALLSDADHPCWPILPRPADNESSWDERA